MVLSPISGKEALIIEKYKVSEFIKKWKSCFNIDISEEFNSVDIFYKYLCPNSQYEFFFPYEIAASAKLYEQLSKLPWYYMPNKWEHKVALEEISNNSKYHQLLEVGCGFGDFLDLCKTQGINAMGIEFNQDAVAFAKKKERNVEAIDLFELKKRMALNFDTVVSFQVLEHIPDPLPFIENCIDLLLPEGSLILTVPDGHGFCWRIPPYRSLLDYPPHHMGKWNISAFQYLTKIFPIRLDKIIYEPLQEYHLNFYISNMLAPNERAEKVTQKMLKRIVFNLLAYYAKANDIYHYWKGHTLFVKFTKCN